MQQARFRNHDHVCCNARMESRDLRTFCRINEQGHDLLKMAITKLGLSARAYDRILKMSRTIADIEKSEKIKSEFVSEAIQYRSLDSDQQNNRILISGRRLLESGDT